MSTLENTSVSIWVSSNDIIQTFKILQALDQTDLSDVKELNHYFPYSIVPTENALQLNVPIILYTKILVLSQK